jgi:hypothetical protein
MLAMIRLITKTMKKNKKWKFVYARALTVLFVLLFSIGFSLVAKAQTERETINQTTLREAQNLMNKTEYVINYPEPDWLVKKLKEQVIDDLSRQGREVPGVAVRTATIFIYEGTESSRPIGLGERMSVIKSFYYAFNRFPISELDWQDIIKISAGRWPTQRNLEKENEMKIVFEKIYFRQPNMDNANDDAMITVATYGLRPQIIDYEKQKVAWHYLDVSMSNFKIFPDKWEYQKKWDIIRGIAYSGAIR